MKKVVLNIFILSMLSLVLPSVGLAKIVLDRFEEDRFKPIVFFGGGFPFGASSDDFFEIFHSEIGGKENYAKHSPAANLGFKAWLTRNIRIGSNASFIHSRFYQDYYTEGEFISRSHNHSILIQTIPILLSGEFIPYDKQFRSYIGAAVGITASHIFWDEKIRSTYHLDTRKSSVQFNEAMLSPAFRVFSGIELGFDEYPESQFLGSVIFEFNYTYSNRNVDIFKKIKKQMKDYSSSLDKKVMLFPGYFTFNMALSFNLLKSKQG